MVQLADSPKSLNAMLALLSGHAVVRSIAAVADLGIPDLLAQGPQPIGELARRCGANEDALYRLLRALAARGLFNELELRHFGLTPLSDWLRSDVPNSLRDFVRLRGSDMYWHAWGALPYTIKTGESAFRQAHGMSHFEYLDQHPEAARLFHDGMRAISAQIQAAVLAAYDFSGFTRLADIGGGQGHFLAAILRAHPHLRGVLFERPAIAERAAAELRAAGVSERCEIVGGDFLTAVPSGADAILLSRVLHDFGDPESARILANCRAALPSGGKLLIVEYLLSDDGEAGLAAKLFDLQMLVYFGSGRERTEEEYRILLRRAGFELSGVFRTDVSLALIEGRAV